MRGLAALSGVIRRLRGLIVGFSTPCETSKSGGGQIPTVHHPLPPFHPPSSIMAPRRQRSASNVQSSQIPPAPPQRTNTPAANNAQQQQLGMLPTVYQSNMKVLLRREPSITAIIDQFSHVCLYHHNGQKWEKHGYEGSMFLFEKYVVSSFGETSYPQAETRL